MVTGKLDVREAAARLPDEAEEPDLLDETGTSAGADQEPPGAPDGTSTTAHEDEGGADDLDAVPEKGEA